MCGCEEIFKIGRTFSFEMHTWAQGVCGNKFKYAECANKKLAHVIWIF